MKKIAFIGLILAVLMIIIITNLYHAYINKGPILNRNDFTSYVHWEESLPAIYINGSRIENNWTRVCDECLKSGSTIDFNPEIEGPCKSSQWKWSFKIESGFSDDNTLECAISYKNRKIRLLVEQDSIDIHNVSIKSNFPFMDIRVDHQFTTCCGWENDDEACKIVTLSKRC